MLPKPQKPLGAPAVLAAGCLGVDQLTPSRAALHGMRLAYLAGPQRAGCSEHIVLADDQLPCCMHINRFASAAMSSLPSPRHTGAELCYQHT